MSGPKGIGYQVVSAAELLRRETAAAQACAEAHYRVVDQLAAGATDTARRAAGVRPGPPRTTMALSELRAVEKLLVEYEVALRAALEAELQDRARSAVIDQAAALHLTVTLDFDRRQSVDDQAAEGGVGPTVAHRLSKILRAAVQIGDPGLIADLSSLAHEAERSSPSRAGQLMTELEARVTLAVRARQLAESVRRRAEGAALQFADLAAGGPDQEEAVDLLDELRRAPDYQSINAAVARLQAIQRHRDADADRRFALAQATEVLEDLGYAVSIDDDGFDQPVIVTATSHRWSDHGLNLVFRSDRASLHTAPIAFGTTSPEDDLRFETESCGDIDHLRTELERRGLATDMFHHVEPGRLPLRRQAATTARRTSRLRVRQQTSRTEDRR